MASIFEGFTGKYPLSKTLRFELKPQGRTGEWIRERGELAVDTDRADKYAVVKGIIDDCHKAFIDKVLSDPDTKFDWKPLAQAMEGYRKEKDWQHRIKARAVLQQEQDAMRKAVAACFTSGKYKQYFNSLWGKSLFKTVLPAFITGDPDYEYKAACLESFKGFTTYFTGFFENRKNLYTDEEKASSLAYRIVNENFPLFMAAQRMFEAAQGQYPAALREAEETLIDYFDIDSLADVFCDTNAYNLCLSQADITFFNDILGGWVETEGVKIKGVNEYLNEAYQNSSDSSAKRIRIAPLYKQLLSDRVSNSFYIDAFDDDRQMADAIGQFAQMLHEDVDEETGEVVDVLDRIIDIVSGIRSSDLTGIYIGKKNYWALSQALFAHNGAVIKNCLQQCREERTGPVLGMTKRQAGTWGKKCVSLKELTEALDACNTACDLSLLTARATALVKKLESQEDGLDEALAKATVSSRIQQDDKALGQIKGYLDAAQDLMRFMRIFETDTAEDSVFLDFSFCMCRLKNIIPLYNKTRNRLTKKPYSRKKIKLNFNSPTLAAGWDVNKEKTNRTMIFRRGETYYLGITPPGQKAPKGAFAHDDAAEDFYEKMEYKLLPNPHMMLPKVAFSPTGIERYEPSSYILEGYEAKKHIKSSKSFDLGFCHDLIDFFKEVCAKTPGWSVFDFQFSDTSTYKDISGFYREVSDAAYSVRFVHVSAEAVDQLVEDGILYLFQIYNRDYAAGAHGLPNLHTLYFQSLFTPENLKDPCFKLCGGAEVFYRPASIKNPRSHKVGEKLVDKWMTMPDKSKVPIPEDVYQELFLHANGKTKKLSEEAKGYLDTGLVRIKDVKYEIVKDRRFTEDKFLFHVPVTMNQRSTGIPYLNREVCAFLHDNPDVNVIGIDRGERCLLYATVVNQKGEIIDQCDLNTIDGYDYHAKLVQRQNARTNQRRSWKSIEGIKNLKEGYLSLAVRKVVGLMLEYNAIVVMEDLNADFKRSRSCIEAAVYQKFEKMLIDKLNYFVSSKDMRDASKPGGVRCGYQLANRFESFAKLGRQSGFVFYVSPWHTASIDPATGFANLFPSHLLTYKSAQETKAFFERFLGIRFNPDRGYFEFSFNYSNFSLAQDDYRDAWTVCANRSYRSIFVHRDGRWVPEDVEVNEKLKKLFSDACVGYTDGRDLRDSIAAFGAGQLKDLLFCFKTLLQMRYASKEETHILSPVRDADGRFFRTGTGNGAPANADASSAYCIALKGLQVVKQQIVEDTGVDGKAVWRIGYTEDAKAYEEQTGRVLGGPADRNYRWLKWMQDREYKTA